MADRYWVGGTDSWNTIASSKWATTSGGAGGASVPVAGDNVFFDANSGSGDITASTTLPALNNLDFTGFTGRFSSGSMIVRVAGTVTFSSTMGLFNGNVTIAVPTGVTGATLSIAGSAPSHINNMSYPLVIATNATTLNLSPGVIYGSITVPANCTVNTTYAETLTAQMITLAAGSTLNVVSNGLKARSLTLTTTAVVNGNMMISAIPPAHSSQDGIACLFSLSGTHAQNRSVTIDNNVTTVIINNTVNHATNNQLFVDFKRGGSGVQVTSAASPATSVTYIHGITRSGVGDDQYILLGTLNSEYGINLRLTGNHTYDNFIIKSVRLISGTVTFNNSIDMNFAPQVGMTINAPVPPTMVGVSYATKTEVTYPIFPEAPELFGFSQPEGPPLYGSNYRLIPFFENRDYALDTTFSITYSDATPSWANFNTNTGEITGTVTDTDVNYGTATITATNPLGSDSISFPLSARSMNFTNVPLNTESDADNEYIYDPAPVSNITNIISSTFSMEVYPAAPWLSIDSSTGVINGTPPEDAIDTTYFVYVAWEVTNNEGRRSYFTYYELKVVKAIIPVQNVFNTSIWTGNAAARTITTGIDSGEGSLTWVKQRSGTNGNLLQDTFRGPAYFLQSQTTDAQALSGGAMVTSYTSSGYTLGTHPGVNGNGQTYVGWQFRRAEKFFDIVQYTGNGVAGRQIAHNLGVKPGMLIVKKYAGGGTYPNTSWIVQHISIPATQFFYLQLTNPATTSAGPWNNTTASETVFTLGTAIEANENGSSYIAYLFAHDPSPEGLIQCGSYVGNGAATGPIVNLGWRPQYIMIKNATAAGNWHVYDTTRGEVSGSDYILFPNLSNAESDAPYISWGSNGFQVTTATAGMNASGNTYVYMAIRAPDIGEETYTTSGTYTWTVPRGVTKFSAVAIGAGGGGSSNYNPGSNWPGKSGAGGALEYVNNYSVNPGDVVTITVGKGGGVNSATNNNPINNGGDTVISIGGTTVIAAGGGIRGLNQFNTSTASLGGTPSGNGTGFNGGPGSASSTSTPAGGAGKYNENGTLGGGGTPLGGLTGPVSPVFGAGGLGSTSGSGTIGSDGGARIVWSPGLTYPSNAVEMWETTTTGTYSFVVPENVSSINAVVIGGGGGGAGGEYGGWTMPGGGGGGGGLAYSNNIPVTPGETLTIECGNRGTGGWGGSGPLAGQRATDGTAGTASIIYRGSTPLLSANGGGRGNTSSTNSETGYQGASGTATVGDVKFNGGGGIGRTGMAGGAATYTANGSNGGGGTSLYGSGRTVGTLCGAGGAGGGVGGSGTAGGVGGVRIIWKTGYSYPSNAFIPT